jgi:hypothetical protein
MSMMVVMPPAAARVARRSYSRFDRLVHMHVESTDLE